MRRRRKLTRSHRRTQITASGDAKLAQQRGHVYELAAGDRRAAMRELATAATLAALAANDEDAAEARAGAKWSCLEEGVPGGVRDSPCPKVSTIGAENDRAVRRWSLCQIGFKPAFSALLILLGICPNRADKAEVSGSSALRPTLARCP